MTTALDCKDGYALNAHASDEQLNACVDCGTDVKECK